MTKLLSGMLILEARFQYDKGGIEYLALYDGFPASDPGCVAREFSVERVLEKFMEEEKHCVRLLKLIIRNENNDIIKTTE